MNRNRRMAARRFCRFERLESRRLMAGNVTAELIHGSLYLNGDDAANGIAIVATENPGEVRVTGTPATATDATELNGQDGPLTFIVTADIVIRMGAGNDGVELNGVSVPDDLTIETGDGVDRVIVGSTLMEDGGSSAPYVAWPPVGQVVPGGHTTLYAPLHRTAGFVEVGGSLSIDTAEHSDFVFLGRTYVTGDIGLRTGNGDDFFIVRTAAARNLNAGMEAGPDLANVAALTTRSQMIFDMGDGHDILSVSSSRAHGPATFLGSYGSNYLGFGANTFYQSLYASCGGWDDRIVVRASVIYGSMTFVTGGGSDRIDVEYVFGGFLSANTGAGNDVLNISGSALANVYAVLAEGDDQLWLVVSRIINPFISHGGDGINDAVFHYGSSANMFALPGFDHVVNGWPAGLTM